MERLFHKDVYFPNGMSESVKKLERTLDINKIVYSRHIQQRFLCTDRSHDFIKRDVELAINKVKTSPVEPFEVLVDDIQYGKARLTKYCVRVNLNSSIDIILVICPKYANVDDDKIHIAYNFIKTAYLNSHDDFHFTLDESKYYKKDGENDDRRE